jgi:hypothetical protein
MANDKFPFAFDAEKVKEMFGAAKLPAVDVDAVLAAQKKNMDALIEANQVVVAGYQDIFKRQVALFEAAFTNAKGKLADAKGQALTADQATQNVDAMKVTFEKAAADIKELAELAQKANVGAFEIVKARAEEAVAEFQAAAEKAAA